MERCKLPGGVLSALCTASLLLCLCLPVCAAERSAAQADNGSYDIVMLIDRSGSMNYTDPGRNAVNAGKMFVDSLFTGVENKRRAGEDVRTTVSVIPFSRDPDNSAAPLTLNTYEDAAAVTGYIGAIRYDPVNTGGTDLGKAVASAVNRLDARTDKSSTGLVVLFTDGYTDYLSTEPDAEQLEKASAALLDRSLEQAKSSGYVIYTIGLNHTDPATGQERIQPEGRKEIMRISNETQGEKGLVRDRDNPDDPGRNYLITHSFGEIQQFYIGLFASMMDSVPPVPIAPAENQPAGADRPMVYYDIPLETAGISGSNLYITSEDGFGQVRLWDPSGGEVPSNDPRVSVLRDSGGKYSILSLWRPEQGVWRLGVEPLGAPFAVSSVPISAVELSIDALPMENGVSLIRVRALDAEAEQDSAFYGQLAETSCTVTPRDGGASVPCPLSYNPEQNALTGSFSVPSPGTYRIQASVRSPILDKSGTGEARFDPVFAPIELTVRQGGTVTADLNDAAEAWQDQVDLNGQDLEWVSDSQTPVDLEGGSLTVTGESLLPGEVSFIVHARDLLSRQMCEIPVRVTVTLNPAYYLRWAWWIPLVLILFLILLILLIRSSRARRQKNAPPPGGQETFPLDQTPPASSAVNLKKNRPVR